MRAVQRGLSVLWLLTAAVCVFNPVRDLALGLYSAVIGVTVLALGLLPPLRLRGCRLTRGWPYRWDCDLSRLAAAERSFGYSRGQRVAVVVKVRDADGGTAKVVCRVDVSANALVRSVADRVLASDVGLHEEERKTLLKIRQGRPVTRGYQLPVVGCITAAVVALTASTAWGTTRDLALRRDGRPVTLTVASVVVHTTARGDQSETICLTPPSDAPRGEQPCIDTMGVTTLQAGEPVAAHEDPANPDRVSVDVLPPPDLGFLAWLVALCLSLVTYTVYLWRRRRPTEPAT